MSVSDGLPVRTLVVDDEPPARELMTRYVEAHEALELAAVSVSGWDAVAAVEEEAPQLLLLDIQMPGLDGFGLLEELERRHLEAPWTVFVTAFDQYAIRAFEVHAVDYLLKPVSRERFDAAVERALSRRPRPVALSALLEDTLRQPPRRILVQERGRIRPVEVEAIDWLEAEGDYVRLHVAAATHLVSKSLTEMERLLEPRGFLRVHRGAVVNLDRVEELRPLGSGRYRLLLTDGTELVVSRSYSAVIRARVL